MDSGSALAIAIATFCFYNATAFLVAINRIAPLSRDDSDFKQLLRQAGWVHDH